MTINRNPLGIRKLDVQAERRQARQEAKQFASRLFANWNRSYSGGWDAEEIQRAIAAAYLAGWQDGVHQGAKATRERVQEALDNGTLRKDVR